MTTPVNTERGLLRRPDTCLYYEVTGRGPAIIFAHGLGGNHLSWWQQVPQFCDRYTCVTFAHRGFAPSAVIEGGPDPADYAGDLAALIDHLGLDTPDLVGYSLGGGVAFFTAVKYPEKVGKLVTASSHFRTDAIYADMRAQQGQVSAAAAEFMKDTPMYELYQRVAPRPEDFPRLLDKIGQAMSEDFDFSEDVRGLQVPTLVVAADADMAPPSHYVEIFKLLDGGLRDGGWMGESRPAGGHALAILPGLTHYNIFSSPLFVATTLAFLDPATG